MFNLLREHFDEENYISWLYTVIFLEPLTLYV